jgi:putative cardiolipin synthase
MAPLLQRIALLVVLPLLAHCAGPPRLSGIEPSHALPPPESTRIEQAVLDLQEIDPGATVLRLVDQNALAFAYRAVSAEAAQRTLDLQYYIWRDDTTGRLLTAEMIRAAERGVRVRLLVDDMDARVKHDTFVVLDQHPSIEVRIFNPFFSRHGRLATAVEYLTRGHRLNYRMHNKAWIADNRLAIVGGRNVGDEYFGASRESNFSDLDVVLTGPIVADVSRQFDDYWNSRYSVPIERFRTRRGFPVTLEQMIDDANSRRERIDGSKYIAALSDPQRRAELIAHAPPPLKIDEVQLLVDDPLKPSGKLADEQASHVLAGIGSRLAGAQREVRIISPYFVPGKGGAQALARDAERGVDVRVLTNSLAATDVAAVHSGYARYRRGLLRSGVKLFELKRTRGSPGGDRDLSILGSAGASLHTKALVVDRRWSFVGSMNLDPRSTYINTEMGVMIDSEELAEQLHRQFEVNTAPERSYRVLLEEGGRLVWYDRSGGIERRHTHEPDCSVLRRLGVTLIGIFPLESQL